MKSVRPKNLNLLSIKLPLPALVSIMHRLSGLLLFLLTPLLIFSLQESLSSEESFNNIIALWQMPIFQAIKLIFLMSITHHFLAGMRHLTMDIHLGLKLQQARSTAKFVVIADVVAFMFYLIWIIK